MFPSVYSNRNLKIIQMQSKVFPNIIVTVYFRVLVFNKNKMQIHRASKNNNVYIKIWSGFKNGTKRFYLYFCGNKKFLSHYDWILFSRYLFVKVLNQFYFCFNRSLKLSYNKVKLCIEKLGALNLHRGRRLMGSLWARPSLIPITK